ncbi:MAG: hypothetical protein JNM17_29635 [Archangium sp.]|nr:hypothetical protein [Archangium sp.]
MIKRVLMIVVGSFALMACGPGAKIDGKQGAAEALLAASQPSKAKADKAATPADLSGAINWNCPQGGSAEIKGASVSIGTGGVSAGVTMNFAGCGIAKSDVGVAIYNGDMNLAQNIATGTSTLSVSQTLKGKITVVGAYDDFLDADIEQVVKVGDLGSTGTGVAMHLKGTIKTSEGTFTFDEDLTVMSGTISAKVQTNRM